MNKIKILILLLVFNIPFAFSGCSNKTELRDRAIVEAMAIDFENGEYKITLQEYMPSDSMAGEGSGENQNIYVTTSGKTLFEALKNAESKDGNQIFYGHSRAYLIGKEAADKGLVQIIEFMNSNYQLSLNSAVILTETSAEDVLKKKVFAGVVPNITIDRIESCGKAPDVAVIDVLRDVYNLEGCCVLPIISPDGKEEVKIEKCAVFKEQKTKIFLNTEQTMGYIWMLGKISDAVMIAKKDNQRISVNVISDKTKIKMKADNDEVTLNVSVTAKGNISEIGVFSNQRIQAEHIEQIQKQIENQIENQIKDAFKTIVTNGGCDVFYLKQRLKKENKKMYEKIKDKPLSEWLSKIKINVSADFSVRHSGIQVR